MAGGHNGGMPASAVSDPAARSARTALVRAATALRTVPFVPEVRLRLADDAMALWERTEAVTGHTQPPPFWAFAWAGGQALARHILDQPTLVAGRTVLDVAAGSGLVAIAASLAGAARVTANEIDPHAVAAIEINAVANQASVEVVLGDLLDGTGGDADVVLAGDVFFSRELADRMMAFLVGAHRRGALVLVGDPGRAYRPTSGVTEVGAYRVPVLADLENARIKPASVLRIGAP